MSVLVRPFPHLHQSGTSAWVEPDSLTAKQPSDLSLSMRMVGTAAWKITHWRTGPLMYNLSCNFISETYISVYLHKQSGLQLLTQISCLIFQWVCNLMLWHLWCQVHHLKLQVKSQVKFCSNHATGKFLWYQFMKLAQYSIAIYTFTRL